MAKTSTSHNTDKPKEKQSSKSTKPYYRDKLREHDRLKSRHDSQQKHETTSEKSRYNNKPKQKQEPNSDMRRKNHPNTNHSTSSHTTPSNQTAHMLQIPTPIMFIPVPVFNYPRPYITPMPYMMPRPFHVQRMPNPRVPGMSYNFRFPHYRSY